MTSVAGVDIGGTKIAAAVVVDGGIVERSVVATPRTGGEDVLEAVAATVRELSTRVPDIAAVGVGAPGVIDQETGTVISATDVLPGWAGAQVGPLLEDRLGQPVAVDNDVRVMARAEVVAALRTGARDVLFVSVGTGIGGALARSGVITPGAHGCAGEIAHLLVPAVGAIACGCGRRDHLEAVGAGPAIAAEYARRTGAVAGDLRDVIRIGRDGDRRAADTVRDAGTILGRALAGLINAVDVQAFVLGGGVVQAGQMFLEPLRAALRADLLPALDDLIVTTAIHGTDAPLLGAALLAEGLVDRTSKGVSSWT